jgi:formate-dependent nitrite reductase membrane component NrfD
LWASAALGPLFLVSGLSTGAAFAHVIARNPAEQAALLRADNAFLAVELVLIGLFLIGLTTASAVHASAAALLLGGPYTAVFWVFVVGLGIVLPLAIQTLMASHRIAHTLVAPALVMLGASRCASSSCPRASTATDPPDARPGTTEVDGL